MNNLSKYAFIFLSSFAVSYVLCLLSVELGITVVPGFVLSVAIMLYLNRTTSKHLNS